jgi:hypothetical protein
VIAVSQEVLVDVFERYVEDGRVGGLSHLEGQVGFGDDSRAAANDHVGRERFDGDRVTGPGL